MTRKTLITSLLFLVFINLTSGCIKKAPNAETLIIDKHKFNFDTCDVIFSEFKYPEDVVNMSKTALQVQGQYIFATLSESSEYQLQSILSR